MKARVAGIAGSVLALTVIGGFAAASTFQPVADVSTPTVTATSTPTETTTVEPVVVPTTEAPVVKAPAPVESTQAPVQVAPTSEAPVAKAPAPAPAPVVRATVSAPRAAGTYPDGSPFKYDSLGRLIQPDVAPAPGMYGNAPQGVLGGPTPTPTP